MIRGVTMKLMTRRTFQMIEGMKKRDEPSFNEFYDTYYKLIYYVIYKIVLNNQDTEEITNDVCIKIYDKIHTFDGKNFESWIYTIAKNHAINYYNRTIKKQRNIVSNEDIVHQTPDHQVSVIPLISFLKEHFDEETTDIIIFHAVYDFSFKHIANMLDVSKSYVYRAYKTSSPKLKLLMEGYHEKK